MGIKFSNLASTTLASGVSSSTTSISVTSATSFPTLGSGDYFYASIGIGSASEVVKVTSISGTTFTAVRGQDSTTAISHSSGAEIALRVVAATLEDLRDATDNDTTYSAGTGVSLSGTTFSLTDTNSKLNLSGGTLTGNLNLGDNDKAVFGASDDLQIYHDGSNSFITDTGTGNLYVRASNELALTSAAGEAFFLGIADGSSYLYHNGSVKLNTTATGIDVTGSVTATGGNSGNWNTAYGWGNHASAGYLTSHQSLSGYATETYVGTQISNLVDSSPSTLNTLNELAAALGDDPNFATTVSTSIGTKLPLAGGTLTGGLSGTTGSFSGSVTADKLSSQKLTSGNGGLRIHSSGTKIFAITEANAVNSGAMDLGASDAKFKDLYLSGTISSGAITSTGLTVQSSTYNKISSYFSGTYTSGFKFSDMNGGIWYDAGTDDLTVSAGHANSQLILESGGSTSLTLASNNNATFAGTISSGAITAVGASGTSVVQNIRNPSTSWGQYALTRYGSEGANSRYMDFGYYRGASEATRGLVIKSQANATKFTFLDSGDFQIGTTTVIDASRNVITGSNFYFGATDSSLLAKDGANIRYLADGIHKFETYNGGWGERVRIDDAGLDVTGTISSGAISIDNGSQRVKYGVWSGTTYGVGMGTGYTYGAINNDYVMSFQMNDDSDRGFWWGDTGHGNDQGAMALSTDGYLTVASGLRLGFGESDTTHPSAGLQVNGTISSGAITAPSIRSSSGEFHVNRSSDGASAIRVDADGVVVIPSNYFYVPASQGSYFSSAVRFRGMISNDTGTDVTIGDTLNVTLGIKLNGTTVIDASRNVITGSNFYFGATDSSLLAKDGANIRYLADGIHKFETYNGGWGERVRIDDAGLDVTGTISSADHTITSGTSGSNTSGLVFKTTDNTDAQKYIKQTAYYMQYNGHNNEGHHFTTGGTNSLLRLHGSSNGTRPNSVDITADNGLYMNNVQVIDASRNLTNVNLVKFRESGGSFYISPTNANTLNAQHGSNADTADMWINYRGYNDTFSNFRDFRIGDGKGSCLLFVDGSSKAFDFQSGSFLQISGTTVIDASRNITAGTVAGTTADFSGKVEFQGTAAIEGGTSNSGYGLFKGYSANYNHFLLSRGSVTGSTSSPSFSGNHQMTFVEYVANAADGFRFKSSNTGTYQEIAYINRVGISTIGTVTATGGNSTNWNTAYGWGNHASGGYAAASALSSKVHTSGNTGLGATWKTTFYSGGGGATFGANHYSMGKDVANGAWSSPNYSDLIIGYHTGIRIGAAYGGIRFYANSPTSDTNNTGHGNGGEQLLMTVGGTATTGGVYVNNDLYAGASVRTPIFYDNNNTQYYVDPTSASVSARFDGPIHFNRSAGSSYDFSVKVGAYNHPTAGYTSTTNKHWVGLEAKGGTHIILNTDGGDSATENAMDHFTVWQGGIDTVAKKKFWVTNIGNSYSKISSRAPIFYDSNNTAYYVDPHSTGTSFKGQGLTDSKAGFKSTANPWNTSDSAFFPNGITTNNTTNWIYGTCFLGNAPSNGNGNEAKAAGTIESTSWHKASLYYDRNNTAYYVDPSSTGTSLNVAGKIIASGGVQVGQSSVGYNLADTFTYDGIATQQYGVTFKPSKVIMSGYQGLGLFTNSTERLSIASNGNVTAVADLRTPVVYDSNNTAYYVNPASTSNNGSRMRGGMLFGPNTSWNEYLYVGGNGRDGSYASVASTNGNLHLDGKAGFNVYLSWYTTSDVQCGAGLVAQGNITAYSDAKLKKDVVTIDAALDKVNALRGVYYVRKDQEDGRRCIGVIAQEVQDVLPELVHSNTGPDNTEETLSVDYGKMVGVLVEAIKELKSEVDDLKTQLSQKEK
jgi:hypothetical protein